MPGVDSSRRRCWRGRGGSRRRLGGTPEGPTTATAGAHWCKTLVVPASTRDRSDRRVVLGFAFLFAALCTASLALLYWSTLEWLEQLLSLEAVVNFGGHYVWRQLDQVLLFSPGAAPESVLSWLYFNDVFWGAVFLGAFLQGLAYAILGLAFARCWRRSRPRAVAYVLAVSALLVVVYFLGGLFDEWANCTTVESRTFDGVETLTECSGSLFGSAQMWTTVVFAVVVLIVALRQARARRVGASV